MAGPRLPVEPPVRAEREAGIEKVATFRPEERLGAVESVVFQSPGCDFPQISEHLCYSGVLSPDDKTFGGVDTLEAIGPAFPIYGSSKCYMGPDPDFTERAKAQLTEGRGRILENELETWAAGATAVATPAGAGVQAAIARVEQELDQKYRGRGVILMSRYDASMGGAANSIQPGEDQILVTKLGTPIIASGTVTPGTVYGLGAVTVLHDREVREYDVLDPEYNQHYALVEQVYEILVDCNFRTKSAITA